MNTNLSVIAALYLSFIFPALLDNPLNSFGDKTLGYTYLSFMILAMIFAFQLLLKEVRNVTGLQLLRPENVRPFMIMYASGLVFPVKANIATAIYLLIGFLCYAFDHYG